MQTTIASMQFSTIKEKLEAVYKTLNLIHVLYIIEEIRFLMCSLKS